SWRTRRRCRRPRPRRSTASGARRWNCGSRMPRPTGVCVGSVVGVWSVCGSRWDSVCWRTISWLSGPPASEKPPMDKMERLARTQLKSGTISKGKGILGIASEQLAWCPQDYLAKARILVRAWLASHSVRHATAAISMDSTVAYENVYDSRLHLGRLTTSQVALDHGCCFTAGPSPANRQQRVATEPLDYTRVQTTALSRCNDRRCGKQRSIPKLRGNCRLISPRLKLGALRRNLVNPLPAGESQQHHRCRRRIVVAQVTAICRVNGRQTKAQHERADPVPPLWS